MVWRARDHDWPADPVFVHKTADQANASVSAFAAVTDLSWPVVAGGIYVFDFTLFRTAAAATTGAVWSISGPASPTTIRYALHTGSTAAAFQSTAASALDTALTETGVPSTTNGHLTNMTGYLANGANAGTLQLNFRSEVDLSAVNVLKGSWGSLLRPA